MGNRISLHSTIVAAPHQTWCGLAGEAAILNLKSGRYYGLNATGAYIWKSIQNPTGVKELLDSVYDRYEVELSICQSDLFDLLEQLLGEHLIETCG